MYFLLVSGQIRHVDYETDQSIEWPVSSTCQSVHIVSTLFKTEERYDIVTIDGIQYSGRVTVNQVVPTNFTVNFVSDRSITDDGFILSWRCTELGGWNDDSSNQENTEGLKIKYEKTLK